MDWLLTDHIKFECRMSSYSKSIEITCYLVYITPSGFFDGTFKISDGL